MRILITGSAGFIGRNLTSYLKSFGFSVIGIDLFNHTGPDEVIIGDLLDESVRQKAFFYGIDGVVHLAAKTRVIESVSVPDLYFEQNVIATNKLLADCIAHDVKTFVFASTNAVVGKTDENLITEKSPILPITPYGATKAAGEALINGWGKSYGFNFAILRLTNVFGPFMEKKDSLIPRLIRAALLDTEIQIYGDGLQSRDFIAVKSVCYAVKEALLRQNCQETVIIGSGKSFSVNDLILQFEQACGVNLKKKHVAKNIHEMPHVKVSVEKAKALSFYKDFDLTDSLKEAFEDLASK